MTSYFQPWGSEVKLILRVATLFVGPTADEQNLSMKASVICQDEKPSPSEKRLHKGTLESLKHEQYVHKSNSLFSLQVGVGDVC